MKIIATLLIAASTAFAGEFWSPPTQGKGECTDSYTARMDESLREHTALRELEHKIEKIEIEQRSREMNEPFK